MTRSKLPLYVAFALLPAAGPAFSDETFSGKAQALIEQIENAGLFVMTAERVGPFEIRGNRSEALFIVGDANAEEVWYQRCPTGSPLERIKREKLIRSDLQCPPPIDDQPTRITHLVPFEFVEETEQYVVYAPIPSTYETGSLPSGGYFSRTHALGTVDCSNLSEFLSIDWGTLGREAPVSVLSTESRYDGALAEIAQAFLADEGGNLEAVRSESVPRIGRDDLAPCGNLGSFVAQGLPASDAASWTEGGAWEIMRVHQ